MPLKFCLSLQKTGLKLVFSETPKANIVQLNYQEKRSQNSEQSFIQLSAKVRSVKGLSRRWRQRPSSPEIKTITLVYGQPNYDLKYLIFFWLSCQFTKLGWKSTRNTHDMRHTARVLSVNHWPTKPETSLNDLNGERLNKKSSSGLAKGPCWISELPSKSLSKTCLRWLVYP